MQHIRKGLSAWPAVRAAIGAVAVWLPLGAFAQPTRAERLIVAGHWKQARALVEMRMLEAPNDPLANYLLSQIRNAFGDHITPQTLAERAVALDGNVAKYHRQYAEVLGVTAQHSKMLQQLFLARRFRKEIDVRRAVGGDQRKAVEIADSIAQIDLADGFLAKARIAAFNKQPAATEVALPALHPSKIG